MTKKMSRYEEALHEAIEHEEVLIKSTEERLQKSCYEMKEILDERRGRVFAYKESIRYLNEIGTSMKGKKDDKKNRNG